MTTTAIAFWPPPGADPLTCEAPTERQVIPHTPIYDQLAAEIKAGTLIGHTPTTDPALTGRNAQEA